MKLNHRRSRTAVAIAIGACISLYSLGAFAHAPEEHAKDAQAPDCSAMTEMNVEQMDKNDPVVQAMMEQCAGHMDAMDHGTMAGGNSDHTDGHNEEKPSESPEHQH